MQKINLTPSLAYLAALRATWRGWDSVLSELIDNALDARATNIDITLTPAAVTVQDDGIGCSRIDKVFVLGEHVPHRQTTSSIGTYGYGMKTAIAAGNSLAISSVHRGHQ
ncbi:MAG: ATP-binding protein [Planctomycetota bacterium]|jgi:DNA topoisomerase VI subunit B